MIKYVIWNDYRNMACEREARILIVGDSYVNHLLKYIDAQQAKSWGKIDENFCLNRENLEITFIGRSGAEFRTLRELTLVEAVRKKFDVIIFMAGGNDLDKGNADPSKLAYGIVEFASDMCTSELTKFFVPTQVIIRPYPKFSSHSIYADRTNCFNVTLQHHTTSHRNVLYWSHDRLYQGRNYFASDGVHLNDLGQYSLYFSIKKALAHTIGHLRRGEDCECTHIPNTRRSRGGKNIGNR